MEWNDHILNRLKRDGSPVQLAIFRIAMGFQILYAVNSKIFPLLLKIEQKQNVVTIFPQWVNKFIANNLVEFLIISCSALSIMLVIGLFTRYILPLLFSSFLLLFSFYYLGANAPINWLYFWFPLLILCFSNSHHSLSIDSLFTKYNTNNLQQYRWPIELFSLWFVYIYFSAGLAKIFPITKGIDWIHGITSKEIIYYRFLDSPLFYFFGKPLFNYAESSSIFTLLSIGALLIEISTIIIVLTKRYNLIILALVLSMHFFLYLTGVAGFMQTAIILGIALLPVSWFKKNKKPALAT